MQGLKHLVQCHCILPQYRKMKDPVFHKFVVFSTIDNNDNVEPKNVQCNNCGVIHKVFDICKSEILHSKEDLKTLISKKDIQMMLPNKLSEILDSYDVDLPTWEQAHFIIKNKLWNSQILTQKYIGDFENE